MTEPIRGWQLLHSKLPPQALKAIPESAYGVAGLTDVNEGYLIQRLFASGLTWDWLLTGQHYLGSEDRKVRDKDYTSRYYLASIQGVLRIDGKEFHGSGAHDNRKLDAAFKGAATVAFKNACKIAGLTIELFKDGKAMDFIYESGPTAHDEFSAKEDARRAAWQASQGTGTAPPATSANSGAPPPSPKTPEQILAEGRAKHA